MTEIEKQDIERRIRDKCERLRRAKITDGELIELEIIFIIREYGKELSKNED